jgi:hypothetical protein
MQGIEWLVGALGDLVRDNMSEGPLKDLLVDGIIGGVGGVIVFLPNILILYFFISKIIRDLVIIIEILFIPLNHIVNISCKCRTDRFICCFRKQGQCFVTVIIHHLFRISDTSLLLHIIYKAGNFLLRST